jgi:hypothetical protein
MQMHLNPIAILGVLLLGLVSLLFSHRTRPALERPREQE